MPPRGVAEAVLTDGCARMAGVTNARPSDGRDVRNTIPQDLRWRASFSWDGVTYPQTCRYAMKPSVVTFEVDLAIALRGDGQLSFSIQHRCSRTGRARSAF